ncbi:MAG: rRNA maturation RNase YbeY [Cyanobacteria bacterium J06560_2]
MSTQTTPIQVEAFVEDAVGVSSVDPGRLETHADRTKPYQTWLCTWLRALAPALSPINAYEVSLRLTDDSEIQQLNTDYRQQAKPTDVLSFAALETALPGAEALHQEQPLYLGDIIISVETATRQASSTQHSLEKELAWLTAHGLLHLLGWAHPTEERLIAMLNKQTELLSLIKIDC